VTLKGAAPMAGSSFILVGSMRRKISVFCLFFLRPGRVKPGQHAPGLILHSNPPICSSLIIRAISPWVV